MASLVLLAACAGPGGAPPGAREARPPFADQPYAGLDRGRVLAAVGVASDRESAAAAARGELAKQFESHVVAVLESTERLLREANDGASSSLSREEVTSRIRVSTDRVLEGVAVDGFAEDGEQVWARVVLARGPALQRLEDDFRQKSSAYDSLRSRADGAEDALEKIRWLRRAVGALAELDALSREHGVVDPQGRRLPLPASLEDLRAEIESVRFADLRPLVEIHGPGAEDLRVVLAEVLTDLGCRVARGRGEANLLLRGEVALEDADSVQTPYGTQAFVRVTLDLEILDLGDDRVVGAIHVGPKKVGHRSPAEARRKALRDIVGETRQSVRDLLRRHLTGEDDPP